MAAGPRQAPMDRTSVPPYLPLSGRPTGLRPPRRANWDPARRQHGAPGPNALPARRRQRVATREVVEFLF